MRRCLTEILIPTLNNSGTVGSFHLLFYSFSNYERIDCSFKELLFHPDTALGFLLTSVSDCHAGIEQVSDNK